MHYDSRRTGNGFLDAGSTPADSMEIKGMLSMPFISIQKWRESNGKAEGLRHYLCSEPDIPRRHAFFCRL